MATLDLKDSDDGNNHVHDLMSSADCESPEDVADQLIEYISETSKENVNRFLNEQNIYGNTPLLELLDFQEQDEKIVKCLISNGSEVNISDSLGMSPLYKITKKLFIPNRMLEGQYLGEAEKSIIHRQTSNEKAILIMLIQSGADINKTDIFGKTPLFLANDIEAIQLLKHHGGDICKTDRCGRNLLHNAFSMPNCEYIARFYISSIVPNVLNKADCFGSTPLHYAALLHKRAVFDELIRNGTDVNAKDYEGNTPITISEQNNSSVGIMYKMNPENKQRLSAFKRRDQVHFQEIMQVENLSEFLQRAEDVFQVISVLKSPGFGEPTYQGESESVKTAVVGFAYRLCQTIGTLDPRLQCTLFRTGSSEEGTKVGDPFEFDFVFCLDRFAYLCNVVESETKQGFAELKVCSDLPKEFTTFFDKNGTCNATKVRLAFGKVLRRFVADKDTWTNCHIYFDGEVKHFEEYDRPVFTLSVRWIVCLYKYQEISIDICPAFRKVGWWPYGTDFDSIDMMSSEIHAEGCLLLLQNPYHESDTLLRISCAPADIFLMKSIPSAFRESYRLCKLLRHEALCPLMDVDSSSDDFPLLAADDSITSYMLKNSLFYILGDYSRQNLLKDSNGPRRDVEIVTIASKLLKFLDKCLLKGKLPVYFLRNREDIFRFQFTEIDNLAEEEIQMYNSFHCARRRAFVKILLYYLRQ